MNALKLTKIDVRHENLGTVVRRNLEDIDVYVKFQLKFLYRR